MFITAAFDYCLPYCQCITNKLAAITGKTRSSFTYLALSWLSVSTQSFWHIVTVCTVNVFVFILFLSVRRSVCLFVYFVYELHNNNNNLWWKLSALKLNLLSYDYWSAEFLTMWMFDIAYSACNSQLNFCHYAPLICLRCTGYINMLWLTDWLIDRLKVGSYLYA